MRKRKLTASEEFDIMKLVLDKFLWFGFGVMAFGLWKSLTLTFMDGLWYMVAGAVVLFVFMYIIVKEYEFLRF
jgi:hypothetical protein